MSAVQDKQISEWLDRARREERGLRVLFVAVAGLMVSIAGFVGTLSVGWVI